MTLIKRETRLVIAGEVHDVESDAGVVITTRALDDVRVAAHVSGGPEVEVTVPERLRGAVIAAGECKIEMRPPPRGVGDSWWSVRVSGVHEDGEGNLRCTGIETPEMYVNHGPAGWEVVAKGPAVVDLDETGGEAGEWRYVLFVGDLYYPLGGLGDYVGVFQTVKGAKSAVEQREGQWCEIAEWTAGGLSSVATGRRPWSDSWTWTNEGGQ